MRSHRTPRNSGRVISRSPPDPNNDASGVRNDVLATLPRGAGAEVRFSLAQSAHCQWLDIRMFRQFRGEGDQWAPTKEGLTIPFAQFDALLDAILRVDAEVRAKRSITNFMTHKTGGRR